MYKNLTTKDIFMIGLISQILIMIPGASALAQTMPPKETGISQEKLKKAEQTVIGAIQSFGKQMDFEPVYREMYVRDPAAGKDLINLLMDGIVDKKLLAEIDPATVEKAFIKGNNILWLIMLISGFEEGEIVETFIKTEFFKNLSDRQREFYDRITSDRDGHLLKSKEEILEAISLCDVAENIFRKRLAPKLKPDSQIAVTIENARASTNFLENNFHLRKYKIIYEIGAKVENRGLSFSFTVVEENGAMKLASVEMID